MLRNGDTEVNYFDVLTSSGNTGTLAFQSGSTTQTVCSGVPRSVATQAMKNRFEAHTGLTFSKNTSLPTSVPSQWVKVPPPQPNPTQNASSSKPSAASTTPTPTVVAPAPAAEIITWQYHDPARGGNGWHNYKIDPTTKINSNVVMESIFVQHQSISNLTSRLVKSGSHTYHVDFSTMKQTNVQYKTVRSIRREPGRGCSCSYCSAN
jgi:hypothetical protein